MPTTKTLNQSPTIGATENADLLWIWDNSAAELDKISLENLFAANQTFALLNGRGGGQTLIGGTAANDDLTLEGTSNATRTTSYVILQPNGGNVGIGTTAPSYRAEVSGTIFGSWNGSAFSTTPLALAISNTQPGGYDPVLMFQQTDSGGTTKNAGGIGVVGASNWAAGNNANQISDMYFLVRNNSGGISERMRITNNGNVGIGTTSPSTRLDIDAGAIEFAEMTEPAAGAVNTGRLFCRDNGTGKTQLCIIFSSGAIQVIATQP